MSTCSSESTRRPGSRSSISSPHPCVPSWREARCGRRSAAFGSGGRRGTGDQHPHGPARLSGSARRGPRRPAPRARGRGHRQRGAVSRAARRHPGARRRGPASRRRRRHPDRPSPRGIRLMTRFPLRIALVAVIVPFAFAIIGVALQLAWLPELPETDRDALGLRRRTRRVRAGLVDAAAPRCSWGPLPVLFGVLLARTVRPRANRDAEAARGRVAVRGHPPEHHRHDIRRDSARPARRFIDADDPAHARHRCRDRVAALGRRLVLPAPCDLRRLDPEPRPRRFLSLRASRRVGRACPVRDLGDHPALRASSRSRRRPSCS